MNTLVEFWKECTLSSKPYFHPQDEEILGKYRGDDLHYPQLDTESYEISGRHLDNNKFFHFSLLPQPYLGNLDTADIFVLMLNPGFGKQDYIDEGCADVCRAIKNNLRQDFENDAAFWPVDERFAHTGAGKYWESSLKDLTELVDIKERLAILQIVPYHSKSFDANALSKNLPSAQVAKRYLKDVLLRRAERSEIFLFVKRQEKNWGMKEIAETQSIIKSRSSGEWYKPSLTPNERVKSALEAWLKTKA